MGVKFFCNKCGEEMFQKMSSDKKENTTVAQAELMCVCTKCLPIEKKYKVTVEDFYEGLYSEFRKVTIQKRGERIFINEKEVKIENYDDIDIRFKLKRGDNLYILCAEDLPKPFKTPKEMFKTLK